MKDRKALGWIIKKSSKQKGNMLLLLLSNAIMSLLSVAFAFAIKGIIDGAIEGAVSGQASKLISYSIFIGVIVVLQFLFRVLTQALSEYIRGKLEMKYKSHLFGQILGKKQEQIAPFP